MNLEKRKINNNNREGFQEIDDEKNKDIVKENPAEKMQTAMPRKTIEELSDQLVAAAIGVIPESVAEWSQQEKDWSLKTRMGWNKRNISGNTLIFDGKNVRNKRDIPYEKYVRNYNSQQQKSVLESDEIRKEIPVHTLNIKGKSEKYRSVGALQTKNIPQDKTPENRTNNFLKEKEKEIQSIEKSINYKGNNKIKNKLQTSEKKIDDFFSKKNTNGSSTEDFPELGHNERQFKILEEQAKELFHNLKKFEKETPEYTLAKKMWDTARSRVIDYEDNAQTSNKEEPEHFLKQNQDQEIKPPFVSKDTLKNTQLTGPIQRSEGHKSKHELEAHLLQTKKEYTSLTTKNTEFINPSMVARARRKMNTAQRELDQHEKLSKVSTESKSAKTTHKKMVMIDRGTEQKPHWFKRNRRKLALGATALFAGLVLNKDTKNSDATTIDTIAVTPESVPQQQPEQIQQTTPQRETQKITESKLEVQSIQEKIIKNDGFTQHLKRTLMQNPEFMKQANIKDLRPQALKKIAEKMKMIDAQSGNEIRFDESAIGGSIHYALDNSNNIVAFFNYYPSDAKETSILRTQTLMESMRQVPKEYRSSDDGAKLDDNVTADPFNVLNT